MSGNGRGSNGQFEAGNPGRPDGTPNRVTRELKAMVLAALEKVGGVDYLAARAIDTPGPFLGLVGKTLPLKVTGADGEPLQVPHAVVFVIGQQAQQGEVIEGERVKVLAPGEHDDDHRS